CMQAIAFPFTF
nr:immunoglobulin light chain junction region [Macaca mulatta]MOV65370.1 immunoglobulin light chain junction region [Macaca mulatta]